MKLILLHEAQIEMVDAAEFYESELAGLAGRFLEAVHQAFVDVQDYPRRWPAMGKDGARCRRVGRFPFGVIYRIDLEEIVIVAVADLRRRPNYWMKRLRK